MNNPSVFREIGLAANLASDKLTRFADGMSGNSDETLSLSSSQAEAVKASLEKMLFSQVPSDVEAPLITRAEPIPSYVLDDVHTNIVRDLFRRRLAVSIIDDESLKAIRSNLMDREGNMLLKWMDLMAMSDGPQRNKALNDLQILMELLIVPPQSTTGSVEPFSVANNLNSLGLPQTTMHCSLGEISVNIGFFDRGSEEELIFGSIAADVHQKILELHRKNLQEGRGGEYIAKSLLARVVSTREYYPF